MNHPVSICPATRDHLDLVVPLFDAYRQFYGQAPDPAGARAFLAERLERGDSTIFLALQDGGAVGFTQLYPSFTSVGMRRIWILNDLFVAGQARRQGVAAALIQAGKQLAVQTGAARLVLSTAVDNHAAQRLYERLGWVRDEKFLHYQLTVAARPA